MHTHYIQFFTATIYKWIPVLFDNKLKDIITDSLAYLVKEKRCRVYGFVIMPNHLHLLWKINDNHRAQDVQRDFLKYTAQQIRFILNDSNSELLSKFEVNLKDRKYQFWQRNSLSTDLWSRKTVEQKLDYIHFNPVSGKWNLSEDFSKYYHSSASFYEDDTNRFPFLSHYMEYFNG
ncbi:MAG: transposase [Cytophagia bacterium]|nr:transposase [Cytophagia bacterium]